MALLIGGKVLKVGESDVGWPFFLVYFAKIKKEKLPLHEENFSKMADDSFFLIDIEKILKGKLGAKYKYVPGFLVSYLKRIVHQDELNVFLREKEIPVCT